MSSLTPGHRLAQTHFAARPRKSARRSAVADVISPRSLQQTIDTTMQPEASRALWRRDRPKPHGTDITNVISPHGAPQTRRIVAPSLLPSDTPRLHQRAFLPPVVRTRAKEFGIKGKYYFTYFYRFCWALCLSHDILSPKRK